MKSGIEMRSLALGLRNPDRPLIMGILNITPDSFSDGGVHASAEGSVLHALNMIEQGADIIDVGGESTRPGSHAVPPAEQIRRIGSVIESLRDQASSVCISVDTMSAEVAEYALRLGVALINDVSAGEGDASMLSTVAHHGGAIVLMHMQGTPTTMQDAPTYSNVVAEVTDYLLSRVDAAVRAGIPEDQIILDPGIGFGKTREHNLELLRNLHIIAELGYPVLLGCSRKRFMGAICHEERPQELLGATVATTALGVAKGVRLFRVHDVKANRQAADVAWVLTKSLL